jgi:hypothetical protein
MSDTKLPSQDRVEGYFKELNNWAAGGTTTSSARST